MITFDIGRSFEPGEWKRVIEECDGHPLHLPQVHSADRAERDVRFIVAKDGNTTIGCGLGFEERSRILGWPVGRKAFSLPTALALVPEAASRKAEVYGGLAGCVRRLGHARLVVQRAWGEDFSDDSGFSPWVVSRGLDFTIDLQPSVEDLLGAMHKYHRKNVRRAERNGVEVLRDSTEEGMLRLRDLQICAASRKGRSGVRDEVFFRRLHQSIYKSGPGEIIFAKVDGHYVGGLAYLAGPTKAQTVRSGSNDVGNKNYATYLLQFALMARLKEAGVKLLNIGAVPAEAVEPDHSQHGLYQFKRGFGGQEQMRTAVDIDLKAFSATTCHV